MSAPANCCHGEVTHRLAWNKGHGPAHEPLNDGVNLCCHEKREKGETSPYRPEYPAQSGRILEEE